MPGRAPLFACPLHPVGGIAALAAAIGGAIGTPGGPVGIAVGFVVGEVFEWLKGVWGDDIFKPFTTSVAGQSLTSRFPGGLDNTLDKTIEFKGHGGRYQLTYDWRVYN